MACLIHKAPEYMSAKQRVRNTFAFEKTDRVPIGYESNDAVHARLCKTLGIAPNDRETLLAALGVDMRGIGAPYVGPSLFSAPENRQVDPLEGFIMRWAQHESGGYWDFCDYPLKDADEGLFANYPMPDPDLFDYEQALAHAASYDGKYALHVGSPGMADIINSCGRLMSMEDILCHLILEREDVLDFIQRRSRWQLAMLERLIDKCKDHLDFVWIGEDLGTQNSQMVSLDLYQKLLKPVHAQFTALARAYNLPVLVHSCGYASWAYEDFIDIGVSGVDTLQPEAANMSPGYLVKQFGGRLNFRGCISTAGPLAYGAAREVTAICRQTLEIMMPTRGYHFAPTHQIQDNTPEENVIAMYQAAHDFGRYDG